MGGVVVALALLSAPEGACAQGPPPPVQLAPSEAPTRTTERPPVSVIVTGAVMFGVSWLVHGIVVSPFAGCRYGITVGPESGSTGCAPEWGDFRWMGFLPLVGPWVQIGLEPSDAGANAWAPYLVIDGLLQLTGMGILVFGLATHETITRPARPGEVTVSAGPGGLQLRGAF